MENTFCTITFQKYIKIKFFKLTSRLAQLDLSKNALKPANFQFTCPLDFFQHKWRQTVRLLLLEIVLPPIFLKIVQELTENGAIDGDGGMDDFVLGGRYQLSRAR